MGASAISLAATGFKAAGGLTNGQSQATGDAFQAQALEDQAQSGIIQANQTSQQLTSTLQRTVSNIMAVRASANTDPTSPTGQALVDRTQALGDQRTQIAVGNINAQVQQDLLASKFYQSASSSAILGGYLSSGEDILSGISGMIKDQSLPKGQG